jgi:hypothetical protein
MIVQGMAAKLLNGDMAVAVEVSAYMKMEKKNVKDAEKKNYSAYGIVVVMMHQKIRSSIVIIKLKIC